MEAQGQFRRNYRARYCNTERQVVDIHPGENVRKYIQDCFKNDDIFFADSHDEGEISLQSPALLIEEQEAPRDTLVIDILPGENVLKSVQDCFGTSIEEHLSSSTSNCSSSDLNQDQSPSFGGKKTSLCSDLGNSVMNTFSVACSQAPVVSEFPADSHGEDEAFSGSSDFLIDRQEASRDIQAADIQPGRNVLKSTENCFESEDLFPADSHDEGEISIGSPALIEEQEASRDMQVIDILPGENALKSVQDCSGTSIEEHLSSSTSNCSSSDLNQDRFPSFGGKKTSLCSDLGNSVMNTFSVACSQAPVLPLDKVSHLRRSKRMRLKPLEYWRGQRVKYEMSPSGQLIVSGIISPEQKEPPKPKRIKKTMMMDMEKILHNSNAALKDTSEPAWVFDPETKQEMLQECVSSGCSPVLFISNEVLTVHKYFSTPLFSAGKMILKPLKEKGSQYTPTDTLVFHIVKGKLLFTLYDQCYCLSSGEYFCVPAGNVYNVQNLLKEDCIVLFTQIKGKQAGR